MTARTRRARLVPLLAAVTALALGACTSADDIEEQAATGEDRTALTVDTSPDQEPVRSTPSDEAIALLPRGSWTTARSPSPWGRSPRR